MKRIFFVLLSIIIVISMIAACGANDIGMVGADFAIPEASYAAPAAAVPDMAIMVMDDVNSDSYYKRDMAESGMGGSGHAGTEVSAINYSEKIIYTSYAGIETLEFDETIKNVEKLIEAHGAFIESSNIDGSNYETSTRGWPRYRSAYFVIRVPVEQLTTMISKLDTLGYVVNQSSNAQNITSQFMDTESRLNSLRVQEERLLDMLSGASDVADLIAIESRLSEVRYQIESLTTTLNHWQHQVNFSTLTLSISEIEVYIEPPPINQTYWERMGSGIIDSLHSVGKFFTELFMWLVVNIPILVVLAVAGAAMYLIIRKIARRSGKKAEKRRKKPEQPGTPQETVTEDTPKESSEDKPGT